MVIKLDVRRIFTRSTTNADARSVCGSVVYSWRNFAEIYIWYTVGSNWQNFAETYM